MLDIFNNVTRVSVGGDKIGVNNRHTLYQTQHRLTQSKAL